MMGIFRKQHGMNIVGQGGKIILFVLPSLIAAIAVHTYFPRIATLPASISFVKPVGYLLLLPGLALWGTAVIQLLAGFGVQFSTKPGKHPQLQVLCHIQSQVFRDLTHSIILSGTTHTGYR